MNPEWYYTANGGQHGPVTAADLKKLARDGTIHPDDLVWKNGMASWVAARTVKGLFAPALKPDQPGAASTQNAPAVASTSVDSETELIDDLPLKKKAEKPPAEKTAKPLKPALLEDVEEDRQVGEEPGEESPRALARRSARDDDEEEDRPARKSRRRDEEFEDDDDDDRSRKRSRRRDEDDDDFDDRPRRKKKRGGKKGMKPGTGLGMTSMICGILCILSDACVCSGFLGIIGLGLAVVSAVLALVAIFTGFSALKTEGKGFGIAGLITGIIGLIPTLLILVGLIFGAAAVGVGAMAR